MFVWNDFHCLSCVCVCVRVCVLHSSSRLLWYILALFYSHPNMLGVTRKDVEKTEDHVAGWDQTAYEKDWKTKQQYIQFLFASRNATNLSGWRPQEVGEAATDRDRPGLLTRQTSAGDTAEGVMGDGWWVFDGSTGWWFQTCLEFSIWDVILPIDEVIFFSGVGLDHGIPPTSLWWIILMMISPIQLMDKVHPSIYSWYYDDNIHLW